jgi:flagellar biosynthesis/type III secretory pathway protein FliH
MPGTFAVSLAKPIKSVQIVDGCNDDCETSFTDSTNPAAKTGQIKLIKELEEQKRLHKEVNLAVQTLVTRLNRFYDEIFASHKEEIAKLSIEIARKILMRKISDGDYEIQSIVQEALKNAPARQDLIVYLNPQDLAACQKIQQEDASGMLSGIKLVADQNIGRAECVLESPKGTVKALIDEHLEQIGKALKQVE